MAKRKTAEPVVTLKREVLPDGMIRLTSPKGIINKRNKRIYDEVECEPNKERLFKEAE